MLCFCHADKTLSQSAWAPSRIAFDQWPVYRDLGVSDVIMPLVACALGEVWRGYTKQDGCSIGFKYVGPISVRRPPPY